MMVVKERIIVEAWRPEDGGEKSSKSSSRELFVDWLDGRHFVK